MNENGYNPEIDFDDLAKDRIIEAEETGYFRGHKTIIARPDDYRPVPKKKIHKSWKTQQKVQDLYIPIKKEDKG